MVVVGSDDNQVTVSIRRWLVFSNGNSFGSSAASIGDGEGNEKSILSSEWMFPGGSGGGVQQLGNAS